MKENKAKRALEAGEVVIGCEVTRMRSPEVCRIYALAGFDFVFIDTEHASFDLETVADMITMSRLTGITPIVRVTGSEYYLISRVLDAGAQGLILPRMKSVDDVRQVVDCCMYPPAGRRGAILAKAHTDYRPVAKMDTFLAESNDQIMILPQIEQVEVLECLGEFLDVPGISGAFVGPVDLSISMGVPGDVANPKVVAATKRVIEGCQKRNLVRAIATVPHERVVHWRDQGMNMLCAGSEAYALISAFQQIRGLVNR